MVTVAPPQLREAAASSLRAHQLDAVAAVDPGLARQQVIMACGTGKTLTGQHATAALMAGESATVLILVPTLTLLQQTFQAWAHDAPFGFDAIAVCSRLTTAERRQVDTEEDIDVDQLSLSATTDPAALAEFLAASAGVRVVFATYQSLSVVIDAHRDHRVPRWDVVVCDEAHRTAGRSAKPFARVLHDEFVPAGHRLFLTATPRVHAVGEKESDTGSALLASMDDETLYGPAVYTLSAAEAVEHEILSEYQVAVIGVEDAELHAAAQMIDQVDDAEEQLGLDHVASIVALSKAAHHSDLAAIIAFFNSKRSSKRFVAAFNAVHASGVAGDLAGGTAEHIDGTMKLSVRADALERLAKPREQGFHLVSNAKCLTEGIDVPALDAVLFGEPRSSQIDVVQCVGRAIRRNGERRAMIVLAVRVSDGDDAESAVAESQFRKVRQVIAALGDHDPRITEAARTLARRPSVDTDPGPDGTPTDDEVAWAQRLLALHIPPSQLHGGFGLRILDTSDRAWERGFAELLRHVAVEGTAAVTYDYVVPETGYPLGQWVSAQRRSYRSGKLSPERVARLEALPGWSWHVLDAKWEEGFGELLRHVEVEGTAVVRKGYVVPETGYPLGKWASNQRNNFRSGKLSPERVARLEALPGWSWYVLDDKWEEGFAELLRHATVNGTADVTKSYVVPESGYPLGQWTREQRTSYRRGKLSPERMARLEAVPGWSWYVRDDKWEGCFSELLRHVTVHGTANIRKDYVVPETGYPIGKWVSRQRQAHRNGKLSPDRVARLEALPGWTWDSRDDKWEAGFAELLRHATANGTAAVRNNYVVPETGYPLGVWVNNLRANFRSGKLSPERAARLEALPGWTWCVPDSDWEEGFAEQLRYVQVNGTFDVPARYTVPETGYPMGAWARTQRQNYRNGKLSPERIARLEALPGWEWSNERGKESQ